MKIRVLLVLMLFIVSGCNSEESELLNEGNKISQEEMEIEDKVISNIHDKIEREVVSEIDNSIEGLSKINNLMCTSINGRLYYFDNNSIYVLESGEETRKIFDYEVLLEKTKFNVEKSYMVGLVNIEDVIYAVVAEQGKQNMIYFYVNVYDYSILELFDYNYMPLGYNDDYIFLQTGYNKDEKIVEYGIFDINKKEVKTFLMGYNENGVNYRMSSEIYYNNDCLFVFSYDSNVLFETGKELGDLFVYDVNDLSLVHKIDIGSVSNVNPFLVSGNREKFIFYDSENSILKECSIDEKKFTSLVKFDMDAVMIDYIAETNSMIMKFMSNYEHSLENQYAGFHASCKECILESQVSKASDIYAIYNIDSDTINIIKETQGREIVADKDVMCINHYKYYHYLNYILRYYEDGYEDIIEYNHLKDIILINGR